MSLNSDRLIVYVLSFNFRSEYISKRFSYWNKKFKPLTLLFEFILSQKIKPFEKFNCFFQSYQSEFKINPNKRTCLIFFQQNSNISAVKDYFQLSKWHGSEDLWLSKQKSTKNVEIFIKKQRLIYSRLWLKSDLKFIRDKIQLNI